jgi:hypothetical protein
VTQSEINWPAALRATDSVEQAAVRALRGVLHNGLRIALNGRSDVSEAHLEDFAQENLLRVLDRFDQFQGRSKFTTWVQAIAKAEQHLALGPECREEYETLMKILKVKKLTPYPKNLRQFSSEIVLTSSSVRKSIVLKFRSSAGGPQIFAPSVR